MNEPVQQGEFTRAFAGLSEQIADVKVLTRATLDEARLTNGRVGLLEVSRAAHEGRLTALEDQPEPITRRDLAVAVMVIGAMFAAIRWLPALIALGDAAR